MQESEAKKLKVGARIEFRDHMVPSEDNGSLGTVTVRDCERFWVKWDDGMVCSYPHILAMFIHRAGE